LGREAAASASLYLIKLSGDGESWVRMEWIRRRTLVGESGRPGNVVPTRDPRTTTQRRPYRRYKDGEAAPSLPMLAINSAADFDALSVDPFCFVGAEESDHAADVVRIAHAPER